MGKITEHVLPWSRPVHGTGKTLNIASHQDDGSENQRGPPSSSRAQLQSEKRKVTQAGKDVEKLDTTDSAGGNAQWRSHCREPSGGFLTKDKRPAGPSNFSPKYMPKAPPKACTWTFTATLLTGVTCANSPNVHWLLTGLKPTDTPGNTSPWRSTDDPWEHDAEGKQPGTEGHRLRDSTRNAQKQPITETESRWVIVRRRRKGKTEWPLTGTWFLLGMMEMFQNEQAVMAVHQGCLEPTNTSKWCTLGRMSLKYKKKYLEKPFYLDNNQ